jgi:hypothetical protein
MRSKNLDGNGAAQADVESAVDFAHAARTERGLNFVRA